MSRTWRPDAAESSRMLNQAHEWTTPPPDADEEPEVWTTKRLATAAAGAASRLRLSPSAAHEPNLHALALSGVGLAVALDPNITWADAVAAGSRELWDAVSANIQAHGVSREPGRERPRFAAYWLDEFLDYRRFPRVTRVEDSMALAEVLAALPPRHLDTLLLLAFTDSMPEAAEAAGVAVHTFRCRTHAARRAALALWFDQETPPSLSRLPINRRGRERTCPHGHAIAAENVLSLRRRGRVVETCRECFYRPKREARAKRKEESR